MRWKINKETGRILAQSGTELAVFGAILLFVTGSIFRVGLSASTQVNQKLKAFRMALGESYRTQQGQYSAGAISTARNSASILVLEDRLSSNPLGRQGAIDRNPAMQMGQATYSNLIFYPIDWGEFHSLPVIDIIVNGQRFIFSVGKWKIMRPEDEFNNGNIPQCDTIIRGRCWEPDCLGAGIGCLLMYKMNSNFTKNEHWCYGPNLPAGAGYGGVDCSLENIPLDRRFDLDFDGSTDVPTGPTVAHETRRAFAWQWLLVAGINEKSRAALNYAVMDGATQEVHGIWTDRSDEDQDVINTDVDIDGDFFEEFIFEVDFSPQGQVVEIRYLDYQEGDFDLGTDNRSESRGHWAYVGQPNIVDCPFGCNSGNMPTTSCSVADDPKTCFLMPHSLTTCALFECQVVTPGMLDDLQMYSFTKEGTLMRIREDRFVGGLTRRIMRHRNIIDHIDIIMRTIQLSNDTDRLCDNLGNPTVWGGVRPNDINFITDRFINPIEACNNCFSAQHIELTCMDEGLNRIYVRSRVQNLIGHKWLSYFNKPTHSK